MFQLINNTVTATKKKPKRWKKMSISDNEFIHLIKVIREDSGQLSDEEIMTRVKDYYGSPRVPIYSEKFTVSFSSLISVVFLLLFLGFMFFSASFVAGLFDSDKSMFPVPTSEDFIF